jgi:hypothetical protein
MNWKSTEQRASQLSTSEACKTASATCGRGGGRGCSMHRAAVRAAEGKQPTTQQRRERRAGGRKHKGWGVVILKTQKTNGMWRCDDEAPTNGPKP